MSSTRNRAKAMLSATPHPAADDHSQHNPADAATSQTQEESPDWLVDHVPFAFVDLPADTELPSVRTVTGTDYLTKEDGRPARMAAAGYMRGISLSGVLQLLHLERKTCVLEVEADRRFGTLTLVNGELVDADLDGIEGEEAVYQILTWPRPQTTIMEGVSIFRHTVDLPISHLLFEAVRRQDDGTGRIDSPSPASPDPACLPQERPLEPARAGDWNRLAETLIINGAIAAAVIRAPDERVLALADEFGRLSNDLTATALADLLPITRAIRQWSRLVHPSVDEILLGIGDQHALVHPLDPDRTIFVYALFESTESLELARLVIRNFSP
jgi:hypothetical protein